MYDDKNNIEEKIKRLKTMLNIFSNFKLVVKVANYAVEKLSWLNNLSKLKNNVKSYRNTDEKAEKSRISKEISEILIELRKIKSLDFCVEDLYSDKDVYDNLDFDKEFDDCSKEINLLINKWFSEASFENKIKFVFGDGFYNSEAKNNNFNSEPCQKYVSLNSELISKLNKEINKKNDIDFYIRIMEYKNKYGHENKIIAAIEISDDNKKKFDFETNKKKYKKHLGLGIVLNLFGGILCIPGIVMAVGAASLIICGFMCLVCVFCWEVFGITIAFFVKTFWNTLIVGVYGLLGPFGVVKSLLPFVGDSLIMYSTLAVPLIGGILLRFGILEINEYITKTNKIKLFRDEYQKLEIKTRDEANKFLEKNILDKNIDVKNIDIKNINKLNKAFYLVDDGKRILVMKKLISARKLNLLDEKNFNWIENKFKELSKKYYGAPEKNNYFICWLIFKKEKFVLDKFKFICDKLEIEINSKDKVTEKKLKENTKSKDKKILDFDKDKTKNNRQPNEKTGVFDKKNNNKNELSQN